MELYNKPVNGSVFRGNITLQANAAPALLQNYPQLRSARLSSSGKKGIACCLLVLGEPFEANLLLLSDEKTIQIKYDSNERLIEKLKMIFTYSSMFYEQVEKKNAGRLSGNNSKEIQDKETIWIIETDKRLTFEVVCERYIVPYVYWTEIEESEKTFPEGKKSYEIHIRRERNRNLVKQAKEKFQAEHAGKLFCEVCGFDFAAQYGERGEGFIEAHHDKNPVSQMGENAESKVEDLKMVCANCHRILHRSIPWMRVDELREAIERVRHENQ